MIILVDMDNVITDFDEHLHYVLQRRYPDMPLLPLNERKSFYFEDDYSKFYRDKIVGAYCEQGFFLGLPMMAGAAEGLAKLMELGHDVRICTSPITKNRHCLQEKFEWVLECLPDFKKRLIVTKDKTYVRGDILVDDKPMVVGTLEPTWQHVLYDQPYNQEMCGPRMTWQEIDKFIRFLEEFESAA